NFAMIFQNYALFPHLSVRDNITFGMKVRKEEKSSWQPRVDKVAQMLQLEALLDCKPAKLSGGHDENITATTPRDRNFAMIFQNYALFPHLSVRDNITFGMKVRKEEKS
ncbi:hypothetical protein ACLXAZ_33135, partial [Escherichia coli]